MEKGFLGVGLVSLTIFLSSCVATQPQVKQTKTPELQVELKAAPPKEEAKPEAAPAVPAPVAEPAQPAAPKAPAPEAAAPAAPAPRSRRSPPCKRGKPCRGACCTGPRGSCTRCTSARSRRSSACCRTGST